MPRSNERWFFKTGAIATVLDSDISPQRTPLYKFPIHVEYIYPKGFIRPRCSYGVNIYSSFYEQSASFSPGVNLKLGEKFLLSLTGDIEFTQRDLVLPRNFTAHSLNAGIFWRL
jgi:hypothetical protein